VAPSSVILKDCEHHIEAVVWVEVEEESDENKLGLDYNLGSL